MRQRLLFAFGVLFFLYPFLISSATGAEKIENRTTLAVMYFTNRGDAKEWNWLRKGLADLLITDLAASNRLILVERERIQEVLKELKVSETGVIDNAISIKAAGILRVEAVLFGSYKVEGGNIEIESHIIDIGTGKLRRIEWVKGKTESIQQLEKQLAELIITNLDVKLTDAEHEQLRKLQTDNLDAVTHFYRGLDFYDRGDYPHAFADFKAASSKDPIYANARYWTAKIYIAMNEIEHGLLAYRETLEKLPDDPMAPRIRLDYALALQEKTKEYEKAIKEYTLLVEASPLLDESYDEMLENRTNFEDAAIGNELKTKLFQKWNTERRIVSQLVRKGLFHRAQCYYKLGNLEKALDDIYGVCAAGPDQYHEWREGLARPAKKIFQDWYYELATSTEKAVLRPSWVFRFKSEKDAYVAEPPKYPLPNSRFSLEYFFGELLEAPPGYLFDKITAKVELLPIEGAGYPFFGSGTGMVMKKREMIIL